MDRAIKILLSVIVVCAIVGIFIAVNLSRPKLQYYDNTKLNILIYKLNDDFRYEICTIDYLEIINFSGTSIS